jgi:hypothetical protein
LIFSSAGILHMDTQSEIAAHDLKLLSIGHYIQGGITAFYSLLIFGYLALFGTLLAKLGSANSQTQMPPGFGAIMSAIFGALFLLSALYALCIFLAGRRLRSHRNMLFIQIVSGLNCLAVPYGTVLGVFTLIVLSRPQAKLLFSPPPAEPDTIQT